MSYGDEPYDGPECKICGEPAEPIEEFRINNAGQTVGRWVLKCLDPECSNHVKEEPCEMTA